MQWAYGIPMRICIYPSTIRKCFFSNMLWWIFLILGLIRWGTAGCSGISGQRSSRVIWGHCSNILKTLLRLHNSRFWWNLGEAILGQRFFRNIQEVWSEVILGSLGVTVERSNFKQPSTTKLTTSMCWSRLTIKKVFMVIFSFDLWLRGQRPGKFKFGYVRVQMLNNWI